MKKMICFALVLVIAMGVLSGCCASGDRCVICYGPSTIKIGPPSITGEEGIIPMCSDCHENWNDLFS